CKTPAGEVLLDYESKYDSEGREIEFLIRRKGAQTIKRVNTYNDKGNLETVSHEGEEHLFKETYSYDSGRKTRRKLFKIRTGETCEEITIYNSEGKPAEYNFYLNGLFIRREVITYNPEGTYAEQAHYRPDGKLISKTTYEYKYDREANCIESEYKTISAESGPTSKTVTKTTISYDKEISPKPKDL